MLVESINIDLVCLQNPENKNTNQNFSTMTNQIIPTVCGNNSDEANLADFEQTGIELPDEPDFYSEHVENLTKEIHPEANKLPMKNICEYFESDVECTHEVYTSTVDNEGNHKEVCIHHMEKMYSYKDATSPGVWIDYPKN